MSDIEVTTLSNGVQVTEPAQAPVVADDVKPEPVAVQPEESSTEAQAETPTQDHAQEEHSEDNRPPWVKKRMNELAAQRDAERQRADKAMKLLEQAMARQQDSDFTPVPDDDGKPPTREQYRSDQDYLNALVDYRVQEGIAAQRAKEAADTRKKTLDEREAKVRAETPDYDEAIASFVESPIVSNPLVAEFIAESDLGPKVAYHLGKNPDLVKELSGMSTARMLAKLGSIEAGLAVPKEPAKPVVSNAPKPATPVVGTSPGGEWDPSQPQDFETYKRNRMKQRQAAGR